MKLKLILIATFILFSIPQTVSAQTLLPCDNQSCYQLVHNKKLEKVSILVWDNQGNILHSNEFILDKSAELAHESSITNNISLNARTGFSGSGAPLPPCSTGSCATSTTTTYVTATHIITVTITFTYYNGQLVGVSTQQTAVPRTDYTDAK